MLPKCISMALLCVFNTYIYIIFLDAMNLTEYYAVVIQICKFIVALCLFIGMC